MLLLNLNFEKTRIHRHLFEISWRSGANIIGLVTLRLLNTTRAYITIWRLLPTASLHITCRSWCFNSKINGTWSLVWHLSIPLWSLRRRLIKILLRPFILFRRLFSPWDFFNFIYRGYIFLLRGRIMKFILFIFTSSRCFIVLNYSITLGFFIFSFMHFLVWCFRLRTGFLLGSSWNIHWLGSFINNNVLIFRRRSTSISY